MRNNYLILLLLSFVLFFTSCLEITEEIQLEMDGSGTAIITLNMSESKDNLKTYMKQGEFQGQRIPSVMEMDALVGELKYLMGTVDGLSNVETDTDYEDFIFTIRGDFTNVDKLNQAVNVLVKEANKKAPIGAKIPMLKDNFSIVNGVFKRHFDYPIDTSIYDKLGMMEQFFLESARLVGIYRFPTAVKKKSNDKTILSPSKKAVMLKTNLADIVKGETTIANEVSY